MATLTFISEEIATQSMKNAEAHLLATASFLKSQGYDMSRWTQHVGHLYAQGWEDLVDENAAVIARSVALNWVSCGAEMIDFSGDDDSAEVVMRWPSAGSAEFFGLSLAEAHQINEILRPIAEKVGVKYSWENEGEQFTLRFSK